MLDNIMNNLQIQYQNAVQQYDSLLGQIERLQKELETLGENIVYLKGAIELCQMIQQEMRKEKQENEQNQIKVKSEDIKIKKVEQVEQKGNKKPDLKIVK